MKFVFVLFSFMCLDPTPFVLDCVSLDVLVLLRASTRFRAASPVPESVSIDPLPSLHSMAKIETSLSLLCDLGKVSACGASGQASRPSNESPPAACNTGELRAQNENSENLVEKIHQNHELRLSEFEPTKIGPISKIEKSLKPLSRFLFIYIIRFENIEFLNTLNSVLIGFTILISFLNL